MVTFGRLPLIAEASGGRVPDPYALADRAALERREQERTSPTDPNSPTEPDPAAYPDPSADSDHDAG